MRWEESKCWLPAHEIHEVSQSISKALRQRNYQTFWHTTCSHCSSSGSLPPYTKLSNNWYWLCSCNRTRDRKYRAQHHRTSPQLIHVLVLQHILSWSIRAIPSLQLHRTCAIASAKRSTKLGPALNFWQCAEVSFIVSLANWLDEWLCGVLVCCKFECPVRTSVEVWLVSPVHE
jgi:hypothetical protein